MKLPGTTGLMTKESIMVCAKIHGHPEDQIRVFNQAANKDFRIKLYCEQRSHRKQQEIIIITIIRNKNLNFRNREERQKVKRRILRSFVTQVERQIRCSIKIKIKGE